MFAWLTPQNHLLVNIPLPGLAGRLFVSPMPWGPYDKFGSLLRHYRKHRIGRAVMLVTDDEIAHKARRNIFKLYAARRIAVTRFPIADLTKPSFADVTNLVEEVRFRLSDGERIVVHCNAGVGRTGTITACIAAACLNLTGDAAIEHILQYMQISLVDEQIRFVKTWGAQYGRPKTPMPPSPPSP